MEATFSIPMVLHLITLLVTLLNHSRVTVLAQTENQTVLKIAVPPKSGFTQFVRIIRDPFTHQPVSFSGFAIKVFNQSVIAAGNNSILYEFISFEKPDGSMNGTYDDMVQAVYDKHYDGAVGDITIRYTRTKLVEFTTPYTDTGMSMLIPALQHQSSNDSSNSLISLTRKVVIATVVVFFFAILVFLVVDIADCGGGRTRHKIEPTVEREAAWKREMLGTIKGTRMMVLIWFIILMFLITYYATVLISLLSKNQEHLSPAPTKTLNQIIISGEKVGYYKGGFAQGALREYGLSEAQLVPYSSEDELKLMLSKGGEEGGITVAIDETYPLSVFHAQHCNNYTLISIPSLPTAGYGFAFRKESGLAEQISIGIIKITDNGDLGDIKATTVGDTGACDVEQSFGMVSDIASPSLIHTFVACGATCVVLFAIAYIIYGVTTNRRCLQRLYN